MRITDWENDYNIKTVQGLGKRAEVRTEEIGDRTLYFCGCSSHEKTR
jgi:hypothetical protein